MRADERRAATYTNLPGGSYVFRVRASNSDGVWSTQDLALPIEVAPSPWLSRWAFLGYTLLAALMLLAVWYAQQRRIARAAAHRLELEQQVSDRTYELAQRYRELEDANRRLEMAQLYRHAHRTRESPLSHAAVPAPARRAQGRARPRHHDHRSRCAEADQRPARPRRRRRSHHRNRQDAARGDPPRRHAGALGRRRIRRGRAGPARRTRHACWPSASASASPR